MEIEKFRNELSISCKNGIHLLLSGAICWVIIALVWISIDNTKTSGVITFFVVTPFMPMAYVIAKIINAEWKIPNNPIYGLGLWLNLSQLLYFPFIFMAYSREPSHMVVAYAIITGAHLLPFGWYYNSKLYPIFAGLMSLGSWLIFHLHESFFTLIPIYMSTMLAIMSLLLYLESKHISTQL